MRFSCLWLLILSSCTGYVGTSGPLQYRTKDFILIDSVKPAHPGWLMDGETVDFPIFYIGPTSDTISIGKRYWPDITSYWEAKPGIFMKSYSSKELEITADTSVSCFTGIDWWHESDPSIIDSTQWYHSFLVILKNKSDSTLYMGRTSSLYYIQLEGQCRDGQWTRIQKPLSETWLCSTNQPDIFLRPGEIILSKIMRRVEPGFTNYRLGWVTYYSVIYSNTFNL
jgi:hypothetical protein